MATPQPNAVLDPHPARPAPKPRGAPPARPAVRAYALAAASAALLWASHFPVGAGFLAWVAVVPFLALAFAEMAPRKRVLVPRPVRPVRPSGVRRRGYRVKMFRYRMGMVLYRVKVIWNWLRAFIANYKRPLAAWVCGLGFFVPVMQWLRVADPRMYATWLALALYCSLYFPLIIYLVRRLVLRGWPVALAAPIVWTALEYVRAHFGTGFPWYFLSHTQHAFLPVVQISDVSGAYGVTFLIVAVNAVLLEWSLRRPRGRALLGLTAPPDETRPWRSTLAVAALFVCVLAYGFFRMDHEPFAGGPRVALVQPDVLQSIRNSSFATGAKDAIEQMEDTFIRLEGQALRQRPRPDLIVWPETSYAYNWSQMEAGVSAASVPLRWAGREADWAKLVDLRKREIAFSEDFARELGRESRTPTLLGLHRERLLTTGEDTKFNTALLVNPDGTATQTYDKMHCVPFGEYVPLRNTMPFLARFAPYDHDYSNNAGESWTRFVVGPYRFATIICYEDSDPYLSRQYVRPENQTGERPVDFIVNISNDGWFDGTSEHEEHLAICRFRAVEARRAVVRSVNMGISAVIDGDGRVAALPGDGWEGSKKIEAVLTAVVPLDVRGSLYAAWGDWLPAACGAFALIGLLVRRRVASKGVRNHPGI